MNFESFVQYCTDADVFNVNQTYIPGHERRISVLGAAPIIEVRVTHILGCFTILLLEVLYSPTVLKRVQPLHAMMIYSIRWSEQRLMIHYSKQMKSLKPSEHHSARVSVENLLWV